MPVGVTALATVLILKGRHAMKMTTLILSAAVAVGVVSTVTWRSAEAPYQASQSSVSAETSPILLVMSKDQFQGKWKQFKADLKKQWGDFTDDDLTQIEGNYDKFEGKVQERYGNRKEEGKRWTDEWFKKQNGSK
jgi:uncharacterized protein YjbJ (UPF0337 family)